VGYNWEQQEVSLGIRVGLEFGSVGGSFQASLFYNASQQQAGVSYGVSAAGASAEARGYYDFREDQFGASIGLNSPYGGAFANTDGQRSASVLGQSIRLKAAEAGILDFPLPLPRQIGTTPFLHMTRFPSMGLNQYLRTPTNADLTRNEILRIEQELAGIQKMKRDLALLKLESKIQKAFETNRKPVEEVTADYYSPQSILQREMLRALEKRFSEQSGGRLQYLYQRRKFLENLLGP